MEDEIDNETYARIVAADPRKREASFRIHDTAETFTEVRFDLPIQKEAVEYPSLWFENHPKGKPEVFYKPTEIEAAELGRAVMKSIKDQTFDQDLAIHFIITALEKYTFKLDQHWISYGTVIGVKDALVTPLSLLKLTASPDKSNAGTRDTTPIKDEAVLLILACWYRQSVLAARSAMPDYISAVMGRCKTLVQSMGVREVDFMDTPPEVTKTWHQDANVRKLMAAIDMFICRTWHPDLNPVRMGTLVCKGRDCAVVGDMLRLQEKLGLSTKNTVKWLLTPAVVPEIKSLTKDSEEFWDPYSYFYYMSDMGLTKKSPYSGSACPKLHFLLNAIAYLLDDSAAAGTKWIECGDAQTLLTAAIFAAFALKRPGGLGPIASTTEQESKAVVKILKNKLPQASSNIPTTSDWASWMTYYEQEGWQMTIQIKEWACRVGKSVPGARPGTLAMKVPSLVSGIP